MDSGARENTAGSYEFGGGCDQRKVIVRHQKSLIIDQLLPMVLFLPHWCLTSRSGSVLYALRRHGGEVAGSAYDGMIVFTGFRTVPSQYQGDSEYFHYSRGSNQGSEQRSSLAVRRFNVDIQVSLL